MFPMGSLSIFKLGWSLVAHFINSPRGHKSLGNVVQVYSNSPPSFSSTLFRYKLPATTLFFCLLWAAPVRALFGVGFQAFLKNQYGATIATQLIRSDLGTNGSFGGNVFPDPIKIFRDPVILVHGLNSNASGMHELRDFLHKGGYGMFPCKRISYRFL